MHASSIEVLEKLAQTDFSSGQGVDNDIQVMHTPLSSLLRRKPITVSPETSVRETLEIMDRNRIGSIVILRPEDQIPLGIFTLQDVLRRVALPMADLEQPIANLMSPEPVSLKQQASAYQAALLMTRRHLRHVLVLDDKARLLGVVSKNDLYDLQRTGFKEISQEIVTAPDVATLQSMTKRIRQAGMGLIAQGISPGPLTYFLSSLNDLLTLRVIEITEKEFVLPDVPWSWMAFGSEGRYEQTFSTDQDNGIIFDLAEGEDVDAIRQAFLVFARKVNERLDQCGFSLCEGEIMAGNPKWCLSLQEWKDRFSEWMWHPDPDALLNSTIFFDFRPLMGDERLTDELSEFLFSLSEDSPLFLRLLTKNALDIEPPIGVFRDFVTEESGEYKGAIDLKKMGVRLFVDAARIMSLSTGVAQSNTVSRLKQAGPKVGMTEEEVNAIIQGFYFIQFIRLRHQHESSESEQTVGNYVFPDRLNDLDRKILKESFKQAKRLQLRLKLDYRM